MQPSRHARAPAPALSVFDATMITVGIVIGAGIFRDAGAGRRHRRLAHRSDRRVGARRRVVVHRRADLRRARDDVSERGRRLHVSHARVRQERELPVRVGAQHGDLHRLDRPARLHPRRLSERGCSVSARTPLPSTRAGNALRSPASTWPVCSGSSRMQNVLAIVEIGGVLLVAHRRLHARTGAATTLRSRAVESAAGVRTRDGLRAAHLRRLERSRVRVRGSPWRTASDRALLVLSIAIITTAYRAVRPRRAARPRLRSAEGQPGGRRRRRASARWATGGRCSASSWSRSRPDIDEFDDDRRRAHQLRGRARLAGARLHGPLAGESATRRPWVSWCRRPSRSR